PPPETADLMVRVQQSTQRLQLLRDTSTKSGEAHRYRRLVNENQRRVDAALKAFDPSAVQRLQALEARRRSSDERMLELASRRAVLRQQLGGLLSAESAANADQLLNETVLRLGIERTQLEDA